MNDDNWEVINGPPAHHIEQLNGINTVNIIEALLTLLIAGRPPTRPLPMIPTETALKELHRTGTIFLLQLPGSYRDCSVHVQDGLGNVVYKAPPHDEVAALMVDFFRELQDIWG